MPIICIWATAFAISVVSFGTRAAEDPFADCLGCHSYIVEKPVVHTGALMGCTMCHATHDVETGRPNRLIDKVNDLCFQCHDKKDINYHLCNSKKGKRPCGHPVSDHPFAAGKDPVYPDREFNCASCHNPHSSSMPALFRYNVNQIKAYQGSTCVVCHWDIYYGNRPRPPKPPRTED